MARWSDLATWRGPSVNSGDGDGRPLESADALAEVRGLIVHIAEGFFEGTISWQQNPDADTSSHFIAGRSGGRAQMVDTGDRAWTQGAGNSRWLSVECEGFTLGHKLYRQGWHQLTGEQIEFIAQLFARIHQVYGVPLQLTNHPDRRGLGYHSMGAEQGFNWGHLHCPGEPIKAQLPQILARAIDIVRGRTSSTTGDQDVMYAQIKGQDPIYRIGDDGIEHVTGSEAGKAWTAAVAAGYKAVVVENQAQLDALTPKPKTVPVDLTDQQLETLATTAGEHAAALIGGKLDALLAEVRKASEAERAGLQAELDKLKTNP